MLGLLKSLKSDIALWISSFAVACLCLAPIFFLGKPWIYIGMVGAPGLLVMILFTGVHGDFGVFGSTVYVVVNTIFFYYLFRLVKYLMKRFRKI